MRRNLTGSARIARSCAICLVAFLAATASGAAAAPPSIRGIGDLPGSSYRSDVNGISADGSVVVGASKPNGDFEAIRWTQAGGIQALGKLRGDTQSGAVAASGDGSVIVGNSHNPPTGPIQAFRWTMAGGMRPLGPLPGGAIASE